jgi:hypothetical protein
MVGGGGTSDAEPVRTVMRQGCAFTFWPIEGRMREGDWKNEKTDAMKISVADLRGNGPFSSPAHIRLG